MGFSIHNRALIGGLLTGVVVLAGASACSRDKRTETATGRDTSAVISTDTANTAATNAPGTPAPDQSAAAAGADTSAAAETPAPRSQARAPRQTIRDTGTAGYRGMERDTSAPAAGVNPPSDAARAPADTTLPGDQSSVAPSDSAPMGVSTPSATDTSTPDSSTTVGFAADQDTVSAGQDTVSTETATPSTEMAGAAVTTDTTTQAPTADTVSAGYAEMARDTSAAPTAADSGVVQAQVDTVQTDSAVAINGGVSAEAPSEVAVQTTPDSVTVVGDSSSVDNPGPRIQEDTISARADSLAENYDADRIRPAEDSTELAGGVISDQYADSANVREEDQETVAQAEAPTDEVGAARVDGQVTGAVVLDGTTFQGAQCVIVDAASDNRIALDMSNTPATLNPCGLGSMVPSRFWTKQD